MTIDPITPEQAETIKKSEFPDFIIECWNRIIAKHYFNGESRFLQKEIVNDIVNLGVERQTIFDNHYLDIEGLYESRGWSVTYDKPAYFQNYEANFTFTKRK